MRFYQLALGARLEFRSRQYEKLAMSLAEDPEGVGTVFQGGTEGTPIGEPLLLPAAEAER